MSTVLLGVTGGVAAYKAIDITRLLRHDGHAVHVVMTRSAERFVGAATFASLSGNPVGSSVFEDPRHPDFRHLDLGRSADVLLIAPTTANTLARLAHGFADDLLMATYVAYDGPVVIAPAMNTRMWAHPATQANLATLRARGVIVVPPGEGLLADGDSGPGRLAEVPDIIRVALEAAGRVAGPLTGRRVVVTAGGTREPIDAVRFVGNRSSGRMGYAVAEAAARRGADVTVIAANVDLPDPPGTRVLRVESAADLLEATTHAVAGADVLVMAAAVADFRPVAADDGKIDKSAHDSLVVRMEPTVDILATVGASRRPGQVLVGFAAEHGAAGLERARAKRTRKNVDVIVHNDVSIPGIGFEGGDNAVTIIGPDGETATGRVSKAECAQAILDAVERLV